MPVKPPPAQRALNLIEERTYEGTDGNPHRPTTAVGPDIALVGDLAAKVAVASLLDRSGKPDQRLPGEHPRRRPAAARPVHRLGLPVRRRSNRRHQEVPRDAAPSWVPHLLLAVTRRVVLDASAHASIEAVSLGETGGLETGGILLGHQHSDGHLSVTVAGDPGPRAERARRSFRRDADHARALARDGYARDRSVWIGDWHTHVDGPAHPSPVDLRAYRVECRRRAVACCHVQEATAGFVGRPDAVSVGRRVDQVDPAEQGPA